MYVYIWHDLHDKIKTAHAVKHNWYNKKQLCIC